MKGIKVWSILLMLVASVLAAVPAHAATGNPIDLQVTEVKINGDVVTDNETVRTQIMRDNSIDVTVRFQTGNSSNASASNVEVSAFLTGVDNQNIAQTSEPFDIEPGVVYTKHLKLTLPENLDQADYKLRVTISDRYSSLLVFNYNLKMDTSKHNVQLVDVTLSPDDEVKAGRALLVVARLKNLGEMNEQNVKVKVAIPDLAISATEYINNLNAEGATSSEELYLRVPLTAKTGDYDVVTTITYNDGNSKVTKTSTIKVIGTEGTLVEETGNSGSTTPGVSITTGPLSQGVTRGEGGAIYQVTITNSGTTAKQFTIDVPGTSDWSTVKINPGNILIVGAGEQKSAYIYVAAKESASVGSHPFAVDVKSGDKTVKQMTFTADVVDAGAASKVDLKRALEIGLVVLIVLLIVVAIIVAVTRSQKDEQQPAEDGQHQIAQTYY